MGVRARAGAAVVPAVTLVALVAAAGCGPRQAPRASAPSAEPSRPTATATAPAASPATRSPEPPATSGPEPAPRPAPRPATLRAGDHGPAVRALQERLLALGYWLPGVDGAFGDGTAHAVVALQKAAGLSRDGVAGPRTRAALDARVVPRARSVHGHVIEVDEQRQLALVVDDGRTSLVLDTSTGSGLPYSSQGRTSIALTPHGTFRISRAIDGMRVSPLGQLWRPRYFNGGIAIHGNPAVPPYPASHGCVRVTDAAIDMIWARDLAPIGTVVIVR